MTQVTCSTFAKQTCRLWMTLIDYRPAD